MTRCDWCTARTRTYHVLPARPDGRSERLCPKCHAAADRQRVPGTPTAQLSTEEKNA